VDDDSQVCKKITAGHLLASTCEVEQQVATNNVHNKWAILPHHTLWEILEQLQWERKASGTFRSMCKEWQEAHDSMVSTLKLRIPFLLPCRLQTKTGFNGVTELDLGSALDNLSLGLLEKSLGSLSGLRRLNLANNDGFDISNLTSWEPALTLKPYLP
jgi:hypothetical protein